MSEADPKPLPSPIPDPDDGSAAADMGVVEGLVRTARPRQWIKNLLVFAAPGAAGVLTQGTVLARSLVAAGLFCVAASGTYFMNDIFDHEVDRLHPDKRHRPIAAGAVGLKTAGVAAVLLLGAAIVLGAALLGRDFAVIVAVYAAINLAYSVWLKREPILDLASVASGFLIRAIAGGLAVHVPLSNWFLIVAAFGSLFMVAGKRQADHRELELRGIRHRGALGAYSQQFLRFIRGLSAGVAITAYCFWAFEKAALAPRGDIYFELTIVPFVLAILRYALLLEGGAGGAPEDVVLGDRTILILGAVWGALFVVGVYGH